MHLPSLPHHAHRQRAGVSPRLLALLACLPLLAFAAPPTWWQTRGIIDGTQVTDDYAAANIGQLKNMAKAAAAEMNAVIPGGAGAALNDLVQSFGSQSADRDDYAALNIGQLKAVAKPFYDRLNSAGYVQPYPWSSNAQDVDDYAAVNVGQLKAVFAFCIACPSTEDSDSDGLADWWEIQQFGNLAHVASEDADTDGLSLQQEMLLGTDPIHAALTANSSALSLNIYTPLH